MLCSFCLFRGWCSPMRQLIENNLVALLFFPWLYPCNCLWIDNKKYPMIYSCVNMKTDYLRMSCVWTVTSSTAIISEIFSQICCNSLYFRSNWFWQPLYFGWKNQSLDSAEIVKYLKHILKCLFYQQHHELEQEPYGFPRKHLKLLCLL